MRPLTAHRYGAAALCLLGACGSPSQNDLFASTSGSAGAVSGGSSSGGALTAGASGGGSGPVSGGAAGSSSGAGGSTTTAGSGGNVGPSPESFPGDGGFAGDELPIDDLEDGDAKILLEGGGNWQVIADPTPGAWTTPGAGGDFSVAWNFTPRGQSERAAQLMGANFAQWGAGLLITLRAYDGGPLQPYDASPYSGISFYGRSAQAALEVTVHLPDVGSHPDGGVCGAAPKPPCYRHFNTRVTLSTSWQKFRVPFSSLTQDQPAAAFAPSQLYAVQLGVRGDTMFDMWIDDVAFIHK